MGATLTSSSVVCAAGPLAPGTSCLRRRSSSFFAVVGFVSSSEYQLLLQQHQPFPTVEASATSPFLNGPRLIHGNILFRSNILMISKRFNFESRFYSRQPDALHLLDSVLPSQPSPQPAWKFFTDYQAVWSHCFQLNVFACSRASAGCAVTL